MKFKKAVKQLLVSAQHHKYEIALKEKNLTYSQWIGAQEKKIKNNPTIFGNKENNLTNEMKMADYGGDKLENEGNKSGFDGSCRKNEGCIFQTIFKEDLEKNGYLQLPEIHADIVLIQMYEGKLNEIAQPLILQKFNQDERIVLIYGDEDVWNGGEREDPWFKPDWSPDRFLDSFYFGGLVAVRAKTLVKAWEKDHSRTLYLLLYQIIAECGGFAKREKDAAMPVFHIRQVLFHSQKPGYGQIKELSLPEGLSPVPSRKKTVDIYWDKDGNGQENASITDVSIIIPSKDHPDILFRCLHSLIERTKSQYVYEIIIVDNGSNEENRQRITKELECLNEDPERRGRLFYLYQPMEFNFSAMCNLGAGKAQGNLFLFLNDDMEIIEPDWLDKMAQKAQLPYVGGVGVKLLYPDSTVIQHAGITNLRVGPAHKLQFLDDREIYYHGMNRGIHNMLAATGACLMMRRLVFEEAGGFPTELAVAFNDVDLCYTIYENGYYNVVRNDVTLYHHESLSRGKDGESKEKQLRLLREKDLLYERHQELYGQDPFYHPYLTNDMLESTYSPACHYQVTLDMPWAEVKDGTKNVRAAREDSCLVIGMECAMDIYKWKYGVELLKRKSKDGHAELKPHSEEMGYYFQGYTFVIGSDNACYENRLLLRNLEGNQIYEISIDKRFRPDIKNNLSDQLNVDLTGYAAKLPCGKIAAGTYQFGMLAIDRCSRQKLINWSSWTLEIK